MLTAVDAQMVTAADGRSLVANHVTVRLAATDIDTTCPNKDLLIDELVDALRAHADWRGMDLGGEPSVMITIDDGAVAIADDAKGAASLAPDPVVPEVSDADAAPPEMPLADGRSPDESDPASAPLDAAAQLAALVAEEDHLDNGDAADDEPVPPIHSADDVRALLDT
ncbi:MAG: DUF2662 domain-containing protein, partial [Rhodobacteraceae bacterium]|nr:DUF2662 domain-containing protein [Paracoccaceae bacterium]